MAKVQKFNLQSDPRVTGYRFVGHSSDPKLMMIAGVHGGENTPVQVTHEFVDRLRESNVHGQVTIIPIVNIDGFALDSRENPNDGKNISAAGNRGNSQISQYSLSDAIADEIIEIAREHDYFLDLHSASNARYLLHAYYHDHRDRELARLFGFRFVAPAFISKKGQASNATGQLKPIGLRVREENGPALTLELGGGTMVRRKDVKQGLAGLVNFACHQEILDLDRKLEITPVEQVFTRPREELMTVVKAPRAGDIFFRKSLGEVVAAGEVVAQIVDLDTRQYHPVTSPVTGRLILKRIPARIPPDAVGVETIFRLMPERMDST